jgi:hypothetical protein
MDERLRKQSGFEEYQGFGGSLDKETYDELRRVVSEMEINPPIPVEREFIDQPTGVMITPEEKCVYSLLSKGFLGRFFGVQPLMAEAMLVMGNWEKREVYMRGYTQINFSIDSIPRPALEPGQRVRQIFRPTETAIFARGW